MSGRFELIVFDFDGTICDSADVKTRAFFELYRNERGDAFAAQVRDYHLQHQGTSRYEKIRHVEEVMIGRPCDDATVDEVAARYGKLVEDAVVASPLIPGVAEFFATKSDGLSTAVASATPDEELRRIVARRNMDAWFDAVRGSPTPKTEIVAQFVEAFRAKPQTTLVVGDQISDYAAAEYAGTAFLGIGDGSDGSFPSATVFMADLTGLAGYLASAR